MSKIDTAVIPVAGYGTRMFPVTKSVSKEMLPLGNRPIVDYIVEDCLEAGVERIIFVVRPAQTQIRHFYSEESIIRDFLKQRNALDKYAPLDNLPRKAEFTFVDQPADERYGTAIPLLCAETVLEGKPFLYINGDALVWKPGVSVTSEMVTALSRERAAAALLAKRISREDVSRYGVLKLREDGSFAGITEKPSVEEAPSNFINLGAYVLNDSIFPLLRDLNPDPKTGEYYVTDALEAFAGSNRTYVHDVEGAQLLDVGTPENFIASNRIIADYYL